MANAIKTKKTRSAVNPQDLPRLLAELDLLARRYGIQCVGLQADEIGFAAVFEVAEDATG